MVCPNCGTETDSNGKFCANCGRPLNEQNNKNNMQSNIQNTYQTYQKNDNINNYKSSAIEGFRAIKSDKFFVRMTGGLLCVFLIFFALSGFSFKEPPINWKKELNTGISLYNEIEKKKEKENISESVKKENPYKSSTSKTQQTPSTTTAPKELSSKNNLSSPQTAVNVFVDFHNAITDQNFSKAFSVLSDERRSRYDYSWQKFSAGYDSTILSKVTESNIIFSNANKVVLSYKLLSKDVEKKRITKRIFDGKATLILENGDWKIAEIEAKKVSETKE